MPAFASLKQIDLTAIINSMKGFHLLTLFGGVLRMKNNPHNRKFFVSPSPFVVAAILFALATPNYLDLYAVGHWEVTGRAFSIEVESTNW